MKIVQTKTTNALDVREAEEEEFYVFQERKALHQDEVPSWFVYINEYAWEAFLSHTTSVYARTKHEGQGIFLGKYFKDDMGEFVVATAYYEGEGESANAYVGMSEECLSTISTKCVTESLLMLIWIHTHPNFGAFYSGTDVNCLKTNFFMPFQTGIVVDIVRKELRGFKVRSGNVEEFKDYALYNKQTRRLFQPYEARSRGGVDAKSIELKKKDNPEMVPSLPEAVLVEVRSINTELAAIKELIADRIAQELCASESNLIEEVTSLRTDLALIKEQIKTSDLHRTSKELPNSLTEYLETFKAEISLVRLLLEKRNDYAEAIQSLILELRRQTKLQVIILVLISAILLVALSIITKLIVGS